jgi:hypothetical protein
VGLIQLKTQIDIHKAREEQLKKKINYTNQLLKNSENSVALLREDCKNSAKEIKDMNAKNYHQLEQIMILEKEKASCIKRDESINMNE